MPVQAQNTVAINIPSQPLSDALLQLGQQTSLQILYTPDLVRELNTSGLQGNYTPENALRQLLKGTGIEYERQGNTVTLKRISAVTLPPLTVSTASLKQGTAEEGYRVSNVSGVGLWDERSLRDTPYSMSVVTSDLIENINAQNMGQIFKMNPLTQEPNIQNHNGVPIVTIRGFQSTNPIYDGIPMADSNGSAVSVIEIDRVEILSGTSGFLYGGGRVGGAVNYVTKNSTNIPLRRLTLGNYGGTQFYGHADIGGKFDERGRFGYRVNLLYQGGDTAIGEPVNQKVANIVLDGHLTDTLYADVKYTYNDYRKEATQPTFNNVRERTGIDTSKRYAPKWASNDIESHKAYTSLRWDPSKYFPLRNAFFYQNTRAKTNEITLNEQADRTFIPRISSGNPWQKYENYGGYIYLDTRFSTFSVDHKLTVGYSSTVLNQVFLDGSPSWSGTNLLLSEIKNISRPDWEEPPPRSASIWYDRYNNVLIGDDITFNDQWSVMVGLNYATTANKATGIYGDRDYEKSALTPTVSLLYKPIEAVTTYVSYMEALEKGTIVGRTYTNYGEVLPPLVSKQYEAGLKYDINPNLLLSTALFRIEKANQFSNLATPVPTYVRDGLQVHNGVELVLTGKITDNLTIMGGGTLMDLSVEKSNNPALEGNKPANAASRMGKIYAEYALPWIPGLSLTGGIYYTGERYANAANTDKIPSYTLYDIGARYSTRVLNKALTVRLNVINLTGKNYWQNATYLGVPRTVAFSVSTMF
ncbi:MULTISPECIES: TonB-dependent siderophore receptor [Nitrosomonas]|uniref:TonB-dependent receptor protein n=1 Tax=Nitrosomonas europaea (strain ATCC 19718 / CIP 103999 / KCTC 2705 / NBRC 14298) TaxID=228410 RepID=Q82W79_NITEU|nr:MULTISPECIES: TonB-dependent receptor [Nitrosomonas]CAD84727.1 TonB-dependent receptor protein [Nitrosomonas europaea ATCC 19718]SDW15310.1 iron complex outermembrane recepter protein [Nitrosomonas europaea]SET33657.1 iron complex outermembrane recepter protein [Nitrosomonas europaea]SJZ35381.1 iron complex outermembrane recepter protein [Nitrosomonas europaea]HBF25285.1 TonB-dependent receptor [Nitrosomonas sp.]